MKTEGIVSWIESLGPILSADDLTNEQISSVRQSLEKIMASEPLTEDQAKILYYSVRCRLMGIEYTLFQIVERAPGAPFRWQLWDDGDEVEKDFFVQEMKEYALEAQILPIDPLPAYNLNLDPLRWFQEALQIELDSYELHKMFVYAVGNIGGTAVLAPRELHTDEGRRLLCLARAKVEAFEPRSDGLKYLRSSTLSILDDKINRLQINNTE